MSWRGTLLLILFAGLALGYSLYSDRSTTHPTGEPLLGNSFALADLIRIQQSGASFSLIKTNGLWYLQGDFQDRANPSMIRDLLSAAADITPLDLLSPGDLKGDVSLSSLGLNNPKRSLTFHTDSTHTLSIGAQGPSAGRLYARLDAAKPVYLIDGKIALMAFRSPQEYRDPRLTALRSEHLDRVTMGKGGGLQPLQLRRDTHGWRLETPTSAPGDDQTINAWIDSLLAARIDRWMPEGTDASSCGMDAPTAVFSFQEEGGSTPLTVTIGAQGADAPGSYFVRCSDRPGICVIGRLDPSLAVTPQTLRSKQIKQVEYDTIDRIEITDDSGRFSLNRKEGGDDWKIPSGRILRESTVKAWFDQLQGLKATSFEPATPDHLGRRGLDKEIPSFRIRLIAKLSDNTAQENEGEAVLAEYNVGVSTNNEVALREGTSTDLMITPSPSFDPIRKEAATWTTQKAPPATPAPTPHS